MRAERTFHVHSYEHCSGNIKLPQALIYIYIFKEKKNLGRIQNLNMQ